MLKKMVVRMVVVALALTLGSSSARAFTIIEYALTANIYSFVLSDVNAGTEIRPTGVDGITQTICAVGVGPVSEDIELETNPNPEDYQEEASVTSTDPSLRSRISPQWTSQDGQYYLQEFDITLGCDTYDIEDTILTVAVAQISGLVFDIPVTGYYKPVINGEITIHHLIESQDGTRPTSMGSLFSLEGLVLEEPINFLEYINIPDPGESLNENTGWDIESLMSDIPEEGYFLPAGTYQVDLTFAGVTSTAPIPGAVWLLGTGLVGLGLLGRRRKGG